MMIYPLVAFTCYNKWLIEKEFPEEGTPLKVSPSSGTF
jgi:hypothetical protein